MRWLEALGTVSKREIRRLWAAAVNATASRRPCRGKPAAHPPASVVTLLGAPGQRDVVLRATSWWCWLGRQSQAGVGRRSSACQTAGCEGLGHAHGLPWTRSMRDLPTSEQHLPSHRRFGCWEWGPLLPKYTAPVQAYLPNLFTFGLPTPAAPALPLPEAVACVPNLLCGAHHLQALTTHHTPNLTIIVTAP